MSFDQDYIYDIETYPNVFTCSILHPPSGDRAVFEVSDRRNMLVEFTSMIMRLRDGQCRMVGFNNEAFDYPVIHFIMEHPNLTAFDIYTKAHAIINAQGKARWSHNVWPNKRHVQQIDLYKINHFDNRAKTTSLKMIEYNMRLKHIQELPYAPGTYLTPDEVAHLVEYNDHDVDATAAFYEQCKPQIEFREHLTSKYGRDFMNHNDVKIGTDYFIMRLEKEMPGVCYYRDANNRRQKRHTYRDFIPVKDIILPYVNFEQPEFQRIHKYLHGETIVDTKKGFGSLSATVDGLEFHFGTGGLHASVESQTVVADAQYDIVDVDVTSYYPSLAIANRLFPEHLTDRFCDIYADVKQQRVSHAKGTPENAMLKLALNGTFGQTNSEFSPLYDPKYTMAITVNGQLLLAMLSEWALEIPGLSIIQANTDGITVRCPKVSRNLLMDVCKRWEQVTGLELEEAEYNRMFIRDVNNYIAEYVGCEKYKHKGAYAYKRQHHQNQSTLIVPKAAEAALVHDVDIEGFIRCHTDPFDFMLRTKVPRNSRLMWGDSQVQNISRYFVCNDGASLTKIMPPTLAQVEADPNAPERHFAIEKGWEVQVCNDFDNMDWGNLNYEYYINETRKLVEPLK